MNDENTTPAGDSTTATATVLPNTDPTPGTILEVRDLMDGRRVSVKEADAAVAELGKGWQLLTPHQAFNWLDYDYKNQHGALSRDETMHPEPYWTNRPYPLVPSARVVVWFIDGSVNAFYDGNHARARAVRVAGQ